MKSKFNGFFTALTLLALSILNFQLSTALAQGTAFTYQGRLNNNGSPANGSYDLGFTLFNTNVTGAPIAGPVTNSATVVSNGLFATAIDFGTGVFIGTNYWLEISVRTNSSGAFTTLAPRQAVTPTPYAIFARTAATVASGSAVTSLNGLKDSVTLAAGQNVTITPSGNTLTVASAGAGGSGIWSVLNNNAYYTAGAVGIGTSTPKGALQVASGGVAVTGASSPYTGAGRGVFLEYSGTYGGIMFAYDYSANSPLNLLLNSPGGNVGIGTLTPAAKLTVYDPASVSDRIETGGGINSWARVEFANANGQWEVGTSRGYNGDSLYLHREGAATDALDLQPNGDAYFGGNVILNGSASVSHRIQTSGGVNSWTRLEFANANGQWNVGTSRGYNGDQFYFSRQGSASAAFTIQPTGDTFAGGNMSVCTLTIRGGCDLAEPFPIKEEVIPKGSVVVIDDEHPGQLKLSTQAYDVRVAGIVSGGNGINPGIALHQEDALDSGQNVALTGRVYVLADATHGDIKPGDLLTTSDMPGHAMKVADHLRAQGAVLGKAMSGLSGGTGMVLVLVTLQ